MQTEPLRTAAAWRADSLDDRDPWRRDIGDTARAELLAAVADTSGKPTTGVTRDEFPLPTFGRELEALQGVLEGGRGFQVLSGLPVGALSEPDNERMLWGLGLWLGEAEPQDKAGALLHRVIDTGQSVDATDNVRGFQTNNELQFHTDGADIFALMCVRQGRVGGESRLVSSTAVFNALLESDPRSAAVLQEPFHFDARAQSPFEQRLQSLPIYIAHDGHMSALYKRRYIETAQRFDDVPRLTQEQLTAMDRLDALAEDPALSLNFQLEPGDLVLANNYSCFHSRTGYEDHPEPERKRLMNRLWLTLPEGRALPPEYANTREWGLTYRRRHGEPMAA